MRIACLFDGAGLARLGLEQAGHEVVGVELDPWKHYLSRFVGRGNCILADATKVDLSSFDAVWASPPCQSRSSARTPGTAFSSPYCADHLDWCLKLWHSTLWVENILSQKGGANDWGMVWNAAQFLKEPIQSRNRVVGGRYVEPLIFRPYSKRFPDICPCITATEWKGHRNDRRRASRFYGRKLTVKECAYHQGFEIPEEWNEVPDRFSPAAWRRLLYEVIGNGVPVYMAKAFGEAYER